MEGDRFLMRSSAVLDGFNDGDNNNEGNDN
jgi:hypothetical protein